MTEEDGSKVDQSIQKHEKVFLGEVRFAGAIIIELHDLTPF